MLHCIHSESVIFHTCCICRPSVHTTTNGCLRRLLLSSLWSTPDATPTSSFDTCNCCCFLRLHLCTCCCKMCFFAPSEEARFFFFTSSVPLQCLGTEVDAGSRPQRTCRGNELMRKHDDRTRVLVAAAYLKSQCDVLHLQCLRPVDQNECD